MIQFHTCGGAGRRAALLVLVLAYAAHAGPPRPIEMVDGTRLIGRILDSECSDTVLVIRTVPRNRKLTIPWNKVKSTTAHELRVALGFEVAEKDPDQMLVDAHRVRNRAGNVFTGRWQNKATYKKDGHYLLKTSAGERRIRLSDVRDAPAAVKVDALEVFSPVELYEKKLGETPPKTANDHYLMGEYARLVTAFEQAKEHYEKAVDLGYPRAKAERVIETVERYINSRAAMEELRAIRRSIVHKNFAKAKALIATFREKNADDEILLKDLGQQEAALIKNRQKYYVDRVPRMLRDQVKRLCAAKVKEPELTLRDAQQFAAGDVSAEDSAGHQAVQELAVKLELEPEEVLKFWESRRMVLLRAFYRDGTFTAIDELEDALARAPKFKGKKGGPKPPKPRKRLTPDAWWEGKIKGRRHAELRDYLYAQWAENSGMCEVLKPKDGTCPTCAGKGYTQYMAATPGGVVPANDRCRTCHMAKFLRVVRFK